MGLDDQSVKYFSLPCVKVSPIFITCQLPAVISYYGYYLVNLHEVGTLYKLNDENILQLMILPKPTIIQTQVDTFVTSRSDSHFANETSTQVYVTHLKVRFNDGFNGEFLEYYKLKYLDDTLCRIGSRLMWVQGNSTWHSHDEVMCTVRNFYNWKPECVEVSINNGRSYTSDCKS